MTEPTTTPTWGTDGGAEITDPGASKRATGFITAEAPAAGHMNHQLNSIGEWVEYLRDRYRGPTAAFTNLDYSTASTFPGATANSRLVYLPGLDRYYFTDETNNNVYDSADGLTWSAAENVANVEGIFIEVAGDLYTCSTTDVYKSTTGLVADLTAQSVTFSATMTSAKSLAYDAVNGFWILGGTGAGSLTAICTSPSLGTAFTNRISDAAAGACTYLSTNPSGVTIGISTAASRFHYSSDGTTWATNSSPTGTPQDLFYNIGMDRFIMATNAATDYFMMTTAGSDFIEFTETDDIHQVINCDGFVFIVYNKASDIQHWLALSPGNTSVTDSFKRTSFYLHTTLDSEGVTQREYVGSGIRLDVQKPGEIMLLSTGAQPISYF